MGTGEKNVLPPLPCPDIFAPQPQLLGPLSFIGVPETFMSPSGLVIFPDSTSPEPGSGLRCGAVSPYQGKGCPV